ncbi:MAG TPA: penicillin-insensitive murein endopeptidase [Pseudolabrys sp.]|jgi:penicillin-insensitive murein endopeptidase
MRIRIAALSWLSIFAIGLLAAAGQIAAAQTPAPTAPLPQAKPPMTEKAREKAVPAKFLFGAKALPSVGKSMAIGYYPRGCLSGAVELPITGPTWQVMRLSRNRNWGHPSLVRFIEKFAAQASKATGWNGILVGDMAQPRGGPAVSDHASHQTGLDVDIWFMPMPDHVLSKEERDTIPASNLVASDWKHLNSQTWTPQHIAFIKAAAQQPEVERVLVNAAIKKELCRVEANQPHGWMSKVRPWYGHHDHIHVRLRCPADSPQCKAQPPVTGSDGCAAKELDYWFSDKVIPPRKPGPPGRQTMLADLPAACKAVLEAPGKKTSVATDNSK